MSRVGRWALVGGERIWREAYAARTGLARRANGLGKQMRQVEIFGRNFWAVAPAVAPDA